MQGKLNMDAWVVTVKCGGDCHLTDITMAITKVMMMMVVLRIIKAISDYLTLSLRIMITKIMMIMVIKMLLICDKKKSVKVKIINDTYTFHF